MPILICFIPALATLAVSLAAESYSLYVALQAVRAGAKRRNLPLLQYISQARDPSIISVFAEDTIAVAGLSFAAIALFLASSTGLAYFDALGSIGVGKNLMV